MSYVYYVNYRKRPSSPKPKRLWAKRHKRFNTEKDAIQWMKDNKIKIDKWTNIEKCKVDSELLKDIFHV